MGHLELVPTDDAVELKNMAVVPCLRGACAAVGASRIVGATTAAETGTLRFYQRCGFRFASIEHDVSTPATGYPDAIVIDGIPLRDRVWLSRELRSDRSGRLRITLASDG